MYASELTNRTIVEEIEDIYGFEVSESMISDWRHERGSGLYIGYAESSKYWLSVFNELKNRWLKDIMILCADGLTGIKESINL